MGGEGETRTRFDLAGLKAALSTVQSGGGRAVKRKNIPGHAHSRSRTMESGMGWLTSHTTPEQVLGSAGK